MIEYQRASLFPGLLVMILVLRPIVEILKWLCMRMMDSVTVENYRITPDDTVDSITRSE